MREEDSAATERELEEAVGRALRGLPAPKAPPTLLARVMAEVAEVEALPWYRAGWLSWPGLWKGFSLLAVAALVAGVVLGIPLLTEEGGFSMDGVQETLGEPFAPVFGAAALLQVGIIVVTAAWGNLPPAAIAVAGAGAFLMMAITVVGGAVLRRLSLDREIYT